VQKLNIHEAKTKLSAILLDVEKNGETFVICRNGNPVANLVPHRPESRLKYHPVLSKIKIKYDPLENVSGDEWGEID